MNRVKFNYNETGIDWTQVKSRLKESCRWAEKDQDLGSEDARHTLKMRAKALAERNANALMEDSKKVQSHFVFRLGERKCAIEFSRLVSITRVSSFTPIPYSQKSTLGLMNHCGKLVALLDLGSLLGLPLTNDRNQGIAMLLRNNRANIALWVDAVEGMIELKNSSQLSEITTGVDQASDYFRGADNLGILHIDWDRLMTHPSFRGVAPQGPNPTNALKS